MSILFAADDAAKGDFIRKLEDWFAANRRSLPWREEYSPYRVWISEIMLQQTQMERGVAYFLRWMERFPDVAAVAAADEEAVLKAWEGLGYYSRARNLHACAKTIMAEHNGCVPADPAALRALPGFGEYTAGAVASIAFDLPVPAVDANVIRVFARLCDIDNPVTARTRSAIRDMVASLINRASPRIFTQALMELGALVCSRSPRCPACPVADYCEARRLGVADQRPVKAGKKEYKYLEMATAIIRDKGRVFIQKRPPYGVWADMWEFPGGCLEAGERPEEAVVREVLEETELSVRVTGHIATVKHGFTTWRVTLHGFFCELAAPGDVVLHAASEGRWVEPEELAGYAFPAGHRKLLEILAEASGPEGVAVRLALPGA